jgi:hypothetical protein|tara:strand:+ start:193 stop:456 length:264 start_codon:yes stop_codon:yes gene_type:complete
MQTIDGIEYHSLYEYLGKAAGPTLGDEINKVAMKHKQKYVTQHVEHGGYNGEVFCYTKKFLDDYFYAKENNEEFVLPQDTYDGDLPF